MNEIIKYWERLTDYLETSLEPIGYPEAVKIANETYLMTLSPEVAKILVSIHKIANFAIGEGWELSDLDLTEEAIKICLELERMINN